MRLAFLVSVAAAGSLGVALADSPPFPKTPPSTWGEGGAFSVRWGMGPGDVRKTYPDLFNSGIGDAPSESYWLKERVKVEGMDAALYFDFFRGRLWQIRVGAVGKDGRAFGSFASRKGAFHPPVKVALEAKYGKALPVAGKTWGGDPCTNWLWAHKTASGTTGIWLYGCGAVDLVYTDLAIESEISDLQKAKDERSRL